MTPGRPFLPDKLARGASRRYLVLGTSRPERAEALAPARASTPRSPAARSRGIFPLPPHPKSDLAEASSSVPFRADSASAKGFHKRAVGFPQSKAKRGYRRDRHGRLLNKGAQTNFDGGMGSKESVSGGRRGCRTMPA